jgi:glutamate-ammonia-ligase adenylyltransferase
MSLPTLAELPAILCRWSLASSRFVRRGRFGRRSWPVRWTPNAGRNSPACAASDFVIEQSVRDPLMLLTWCSPASWTGVRPGELCAQIAAA